LTKSIATLQPGHV